MGNGVETFSVTPLFLVTLSESLAEIMRQHSCLMMTQPLLQCRKLVSEVQLSLLGKTACPACSEQLMAVEHHYTLWEVTMVM